MFDQISWICPAWSVGTSVPKSRPTSSYLSPRHFMAASTMSGSWPMILLGLFGSRYMIGGRVGSSPTLSVLPASPGYFVATLSGSQAACAGPAVPKPTVAATSPARTAPAQFLILRPPFLTRSSALQWRARSGARARPAAEHVTSAAGLAHELALPGHDLAAGEGQHRHAAQLEAVERIVAGPRVEPPLVDHATARRIEEDHVGVAAPRDRAILRIEPEDARRVGRERGHEGLHRDAGAADPFRVDHRHLGLEPGHPVRHPGEILGPRRLLLDRPRGIVAADRLDVARAQALPEGGLIARGAQRRRAHELGRLRPAHRVALLGQGQVDRARLGPH